ncbi:MAG: vitamin K epoxide reductase family protein [Longimicrobiales bacterium]
MLLLMTPALAGAQEAAAQEAPPTEEESVTQEAPVVHGVLFYSPTCSHCREVMTETLPPILSRYGDGLQIVSVNTATPGGQQLYRATVEALAVPRERAGVPALLVGSRLLVGSIEIPGLLPDIADSALAGSGIDWPPVPLIRQALAAQGVIPQSAVATSGEATGAETAATDTAGADTARETTADQEAPQSPEEADAQAPGADEPPGDSASDPAPESAAAEPDAAVPPADAEVGPEVLPDETRDSQPEHADTAPEEDAGSGPTRGELEDPAERPEPVEGPESRVTAEDSLLAGALDADGRMSLVHELSVRQRLMLDPAGNGFAIAVLIVMLAVLLLVLGDLAGRIRIPSPPVWAIPALAVVGLGVAAYLAVVEVTGADAVCGPVGNCNIVQQSPYARLLGVPIGVLGVVGYAVLLATWAAGRLVPEARFAARSATWWMALGATGFSIYLTFLEPFVIGASCAWCLTSAVAATLILVAATPERRAAVAGATPEAEAAGSRP